MKVKAVAMFFIVFAAGCARNKMIVMTVTGPVKAERIGFTLSHEHILVDFGGAEKSGAGRYDRAKVEAVALPFLIEAKKAGVQTFIECTPAYMARDPVLLKSLSEKSELFILTNTGYYGSNNDKHIPGHAFGESAEQIAARWVREWRDGIEGTGIKPGFIKTAVDMGEELSEIDAKLIAAAAITHLETGLVIACHTGSAKLFFEEVGILKEYGVSAEALIWTHAQTGDKLSRVKAAKEGAWVSIDNVSDDAAVISATIESVNDLKRQNLLDRVLISHDAGWYDVGNPGGTVFRHFTSVSNKLVGALREKGFTDEQINLLFIENPRNAFTIRVRK